jgi:hypothetical protein
MKRLILLAIACALSACGGGGDQEPEDMVGPPLCVAQPGLCK